MSIQHEAGSLLRVLKKPTYNVAQARLVDLTKVSWFLVLAGERGPRGLHGRNLINFKGYLALCHPLSGLQPPNPSQGVSLAPLLTQSESFSLCGSSHPCPLASLLFTDLSKLIPLPLAQGRDADRLSVCINARVLMTVTYLKHLKASSHKN